MSSPWRTIKVLLKPWWAKLALFLILTFGPVIWYATFIYMGWHNEQVVLTQFKQRQQMYGYTSGKRNILPEFLQAYDSLKAYGERTLEVDLTLFGTVEEVPLVGNFKYVQNLEMSYYQTVMPNLYYLPGMYDLKVLSIRADKINGASATYIARVPSMKHLQISGAEFDQEGFRKIVNHSKLEFIGINIGSTVLNYGYVKPTQITFFSENCKIPLIELNMSHLDQKAANSLRSLTTKSETRLGLNAYMFNHHKFLDGLNTVSRLSLQANPFMYIGKPDWQALPQETFNTISKMERIETLVLKEFSLTGENMEALENCSTLENLILEVCNLDKKGLDVIAKMPSLKLLAIRKCKLPFEELNVLAKSKSLKFLIGNTDTDVPKLYRLYLEEELPNISFTDRDSVNQLFSNPFTSRFDQYFNGRDD